MGRRFLGALLGLLVLVCGVGAVAVAIWGDDALERDVQKALQLPARLPRELNLFNPIAGFGVAEGKNPAEEGYAAITRVNELLAAPGPSDEEKLGDKVRRAWVVSKLTVGDDENILCSPKDDGCVARLWSGRDELRALASAHQTLLDRYRGLADFTDYRMELHPHVEMPLPEFRTLRATHRLWLGMQAASYSHGASGALDAVLGDLRFLRRVLAQADDLLTKMVVADMVVEDLHVFAAIMDREGALLDEFPALESLSGQEASLESALRSEFRFSTSAFLTLDNRPETYDNLGLPRWLGAVGLRPLFKPNRSVNSAHRCWEQVRAATRLKPVDVLARGSAETEKGCEFRWTEWISNPLGTTIVSIAQPDLSHYAARLHDLRGLITLVNLKRSIRRAGIAEDQLAKYLSTAGSRFTDPYLGKLVWKSETRTLYFTSPQPRRGYNHLPLYPLG